jgi:short-subunit dehydrogenase
METSSLIFPDEAAAAGNGEKRIFVVGATSSLAQAICRAFAAKGHRLIMAGRDPKELEVLAGDLATRFSTPCKTVVADFMAANFSPASVMEQAGEFDHIIIASGDMGNGDSNSLYNLAYTVHVNYTIPAQIATLAGQYLGDKGEGSIVIISSISGDRGRQSNYPYGSAKAALTTFASGLRNSLYKKGVHVLTVLPGFIDTPMTWGMESKLIASREKVAQDIIKVMETRRSPLHEKIICVLSLAVIWPEGDDVLYVPWFWRYIMLIIRHIPEFIFKRLKL